MRKNFWLLELESFLQNQKCNQVCDRVRNCLNNSYRENKNEHVYLEAKMVGTKFNFVYQSPKKTTQKYRKKQC